MLDPAIEIKFIVAIKINLMLGSSISFAVAKEVSVLVDLKADEKFQVKSGYTEKPNFNADFYVFGMIGAILIYLFVWMKFVEKESWKNSIILTVCVGGVAWLIFSVWLGVNFPEGLIIKTFF